MKDEIINLIDMKIKESARAVDESTLAGVRDVWDEITPAPNCPHSGELMERIKEIIHKGLLERAEALSNTVSSTVCTIGADLSIKLQEDILEVVRNNYPKDQYVTSAINTQGVYERRNMSAKKFHVRSFELELAVISSMASTFSNRVVLDTKTTLEEIRITKAISKPSKTEVLFGGIKKWVAIPVVKLIFTIISAVVAGVILFKLGANHG